MSPLRQQPASHLATSAQPHQAPTNKNESKKPTFSAAAFWWEIIKKKKRRKRKKRKKNRRLPLYAQYRKEQQRQRLSDVRRAVRFL
jgi:hypothetical protein